MDENRVYYPYSRSYRKEVISVATTTFDKNIILNEEAAERLAEILAEPAPPRAKLDENFWEENERKKEEWFTRLKK